MTKGDEVGDISDAVTSREYPINDRRFKMNLAILRWLILIAQIPAKRL